MGQDVSIKIRHHDNAQAHNQASPPVHSDFAKISSPFSLIRRIFCGQRWIFSDCSQTSASEVEGRIITQISFLNAGKNAQVTSHVFQ